MNNVKDEESVSFEKNEDIAGQTSSFARLLQLNLGLAGDR